MLWRCNMASCRVLFAGIFTLSSCFLNSKGVLLLRSMLFFFLVSQFTIVAWHFNSSCAASNIRVALQVFVWRFKSSRGAPSPFSSLWQHRFQSCDAQRTYDSLILILHLKRGYSPFCASVLLITKGRLPNINIVIAQISHFSNFFELKRRFIYEHSKPEQCQIFS